MIGKHSLIALALGIVFGLCLIGINSLFSFSNGTSPKNNLTEAGEISYLSINDTEQLLLTSLRLFGLTREENADKSEITSDLLSKDITIRIIAQAKVGTTQNTMLEIATDNETKQIRVQEGSIINGLLVKSITDKQLIVEKDTIEYSIKLFHPKELNTTITEQSHDIQQ